jgi:NDP-sugar pyrophosphorylase family protein
MEKKIEHIKSLIDRIEDIKIYEIHDIFYSIINDLTSKINNYKGDYPTFIEPVFLEKNVEIGDDVLLGPNVYIGSHSIIGDYVEISNSIILDNVRIGENIKLENCIVGKNSNLNLSKFIVKDSLILGSGTSADDLKIVKI